MSQISVKGNSSLLHHLLFDFVSWSAARCSFPLSILIKPRCLFFINAFSGRWGIIHRDTVASTETRPHAISQLHCSSWFVHSRSCFQRTRKFNLRKVYHNVCIYLVFVQFIIIFAQQSSLARLLTDRHWRSKEKKKNPAEESSKRPNQTRHSKWTLIAIKMLFSSFPADPPFIFVLIVFAIIFLKHKEQTEIPFLRTPFVRPSRLWLLIPIRIGKQREQPQRKPAADWPPKSNCGIIESVNTLYCNNKFTSTKDSSFLIHRHLWVEEMNFKLIQSFSSSISDATGLLLFLVHKGGPQNQ